MPEERFFHPQTVMIQLHQPFCIHKKRDENRGRREKNCKSKNLYRLQSLCPATRQNHLDDPPHQTFSGQAGGDALARGSQQPEWAWPARQLPSPLGFSASGQSARREMPGRSWAGGDANRAGQGSCCTKVRFCDGPGIGFFRPNLPLPGSAVKSRYGFTWGFPLPCFPSSIETWFF